MTEGQERKLSESLNMVKYLLHRLLLNSDGTGHWCEYCAPAGSEGKKIKVGSQEIIMPTDGFQPSQIKRKKK